MPDNIQDLDLKDELIAERKIGFFKNLLPPVIGPKTVPGGIKRNIIKFHKGK